MALLDSEKTTSAQALAWQRKWTGLLIVAQCVLVNIVFVLESIHWCSASCSRGTVHGLCDAACLYTHSRTAVDDAVIYMV